MVLYLLTVFFAMVIICFFNIMFGPETFSHYAIWVIVSTIVSVMVEIAISGIGSLITVRSPSNWFNPEKKLFVVSKKEQKFYEKVGIRHWKDKVWELGGLGGFRRNKLKSQSNAEYLHRFIIESNKGMVGHIINIFTGFLVIFILPLKYALRIGFPVAIVGAWLNFLPTCVLRYNLPKLNIAYKRASRLENRKPENNVVDEEQEESVQGAN